MLQASISRIYCNLPNRMRALYFSVACVVEGAPYEDIRMFFANFQHVPAVLFVFNLALGIRLHDLYYFFSSMTQLVLFYYLDGLSVAIRSERPPTFDHVLCRKSQYALPDPLFVTTITYCLTVTYGLMYRRAIAQKIGILYKLIFVLVPLFYIVGLVINDYFTWWQLFVNLFLSFATSFFYVYFYWLLVCTFGVLVGWRHWMVNFLGTENVILAAVPDYPDAIKQRRRQMSKKPQVAV